MSVALKHVLRDCAQLVLLLDADFLVSRGLSDPEHYPFLQSLTAGQRLVVLPAFETSDETQAAAKNASLVAYGA